jgi:hypothetical protein
VAKRGRPPGATTRLRNPNNFAAHHALTLMELWLADAPVLEIRAMLSSLAGNPEHQALIQECWRQRGNERRYTVPPKGGCRDRRIRTRHHSIRKMAGLTVAVIAGGASRDGVGSLRSGFYDVRIIAVDCATIAHFQVELSESPRRRSVTWQRFLWSRPAGTSRLQAG